MWGVPWVVVAALVVVLVSVFAWAEIAHWRSSRRRLGEGRGSGRKEAVVVLGFKNRGERANSVNRYRVRAALRSIDPQVTETVLVLCGGAVASQVPEAVLLERYARDLGFTGEIVLDRDSRTTWENIANAIPFVEDADSIKIVSDSLHAEKGRACLWALRPDLAVRLRQGGEHRFGERTLVKPIVVLHGSRRLREMADADVPAQEGDDDVRRRRRVVPAALTPRRGRAAA